MAYFKSMIIITIDPNTDTWAPISQKKIFTHFRLCVPWARHTSKRFKIADTLASEGFMAQIRLAY